MSRSSTDSGANDPPGELAWPRWTEKEESESLCAGWSAARCRTVRRLKSQRACQLSSLMPGAVWSYDSCSDGTPSKTRRRSVYNAEKLEGNQRQQISEHKKPLCSIVLRHMFPLMGRMFQGAIGLSWTLDRCWCASVTVSVSKLADVITADSRFKTQT